jgi:hypothetical protein
MSNSDRRKIVKEITLAYKLQYDAYTHNGAYDIRNLPIHLIYDTKKIDEQILSELRKKIKNKLIILHKDKIVIT